MVQRLFIRALDLSRSRYSKRFQGERCTALYGVPTLFIAQLDHPEFDRFDLSSLRTGIMAGSPCPIVVMQRVVERMHMREVTRPLRRCVPDDRHG